MKWERGPLIYEGKGKRVYQVSNNDQTVWVEFKDDLTAFNALKKGSFGGKGRVNKDITHVIFRYLEKNGVATHLMESVAEESLVCRRLKMIPLEVVVRNRLAGSTAKKFNREEGEVLKRTLVEFYYKSDALADPFISDDQALMLEAVESQKQLDSLKQAALSVNSLLLVFFRECSLDLIDFKLEFGWDNEGKMRLGDEITPDCCRLWDSKTQEKMDKDRFRRDLGRVEESYREVWKRISEKGV